MFMKRTWFPKAACFSDYFILISPVIYYRKYAFTVSVDRPMAAGGRIMILKKFEYSEFADKPNAWSLNGLVLENINLLVGKNATGKTNTLTKIVWLGNMLAGRLPQLLNSGNFDVEFTHNTDVGFDITTASTESIRHPSSILKQIYQKVGKDYKKKKWEAERTVNDLDYENLYIHVRHRSNSLNELLTCLDGLIP